MNLKLHKQLAHSHISFFAGLLSIMKYGRASVHLCESYVHLNTGTWNSCVETGAVNQR